MPLKPKKISTDNIMKSLENAGIVIEKYDSPIPIPEGKIPVVFDDGTEAFIDPQFIKFDEEPYSYNNCDAVYTNTMETILLSNTNDNKYVSYDLQKNIPKYECNIFVDKLIA